MDVNLADLLRGIQERDAQDMNRAIAPLKPAEDAVVIDSSAMNIQQVFERVVQLAQAKGLV
jgi:cytidylate kinase